MRIENNNAKELFSCALYNGGCCYIVDEWKIEMKEVDEEVVG